MPPDDPPALACALARVLADEELGRRLGAAGPGRIAEGFLAEQMVAAHDRLYRQVVEDWGRLHGRPGHW